MGHKLTMRDSPFQIDFCGLGAPKAGSTWIAEMLDCHPDLCMSQPKEVAYFNKADPYHGDNCNFGRPLSWYQKHFRHCPGDVLKGEFTTCYLWDVEAPRALRQHNSAVRLIVCLRDPVNRAYSMYWMRKQYLHEERQPTFEAAVAVDRNYLDVGLYAGQLARYLELFDREQMHYVLFEDMIDTPVGVARELYRFLGVDAAFLPAEIDRPRKQARRARTGWAVGLMRSVNRALVGANMSGAARWLKRRGLKDMFMRISTEAAAYPPLDPDTRRRLVEYFAEDTEQLERLLGRDLSRWKAC
jgi:hypothetical protein